MGHIPNGDGSLLKITQFLLLQPLMFGAVPPHNTGVLHRIVRRRRRPRKSSMPGIERVAYADVKNGYELLEWDTETGT